MSDISFICPECEGRLVVDDSGSGADVACPHCGNPVKVPEPPPSLSEPAPPIVLEPGQPGIKEKLHLKKPVDEAWREHHPPEDHVDPEQILSKLGIDPDEPAAEGESETEGNNSHHVEQHSQDINVGQPWNKKHDQWFTEDGKRYHFCYYNPQDISMLTACGEKMGVRESTPAPENLTKIKKKAFCKNCVSALE